MSPEELKFFAEVEALLTTVAQPGIEYRLYYNRAGEITMGSMTTDTLPTDSYIIVTKEEYETYFLYRVVNKKLKKIDNDAGYRVQLTPSNTGLAVVAGHAGLLLEPDETYPNIEYYAYRNN